MPALLKKQSMRAVGVERRLHVGLHIGGFGDVGSDELRLAALLRMMPAVRFAAGGVAIDDDHLGAALGESRAPSPGRCRLPRR